MASSIVQPYQNAQVTVLAGSALATFSAAPYSIQQQTFYSNEPVAVTSAFGPASGSNVTSAYAAQTIVYIAAGSQPVLYNVGTGPVVTENLNFLPASSPGTLNATGTLTAALILSKIVTSSTAAAVTATLDTGANIDAVQTFGVGDVIRWSAINTGGTNAFTLAASTGHTIVGNPAVAANTSAVFMTVKTAANTFVTYRAA